MIDLIRVIDFETTDLPPNAEVIEVGWCDIVHKDEAWTVAPSWHSHLCDTTLKIAPTASATHHLIADDLKGCMSFMEFVAASGFGILNTVAAHRADFEKAFFNPPDVRWIDTWKVALRLAPKAPSHSNQALRYWLGLKVDRKMAEPAHRAGPDAYVTAHLLRRMLAKASVEEMVTISAEPALLPNFGFGKHAMVPIDDIPDDYLEWVLGQSFDADVLHTARHHLNQRKAMS
jgi:exodeoxyribonuclease X